MRRAEPRIESRGEIREKLRGSAQIRRRAVVTSWRRGVRQRGGGLPSERANAADTTRVSSERGKPARSHGISLPTSSRSRVNEVRGAGAFVQQPSQQRPGGACSLAGSGFPSASPPTGADSSSSHERGVVLQARQQGGRASSATASVAQPARSSGQQANPDTASGKSREANSRFSQQQNSIQAANAVTSARWMALERGTDGNSDDVRRLGAPTGWTPVHEE